MHLSSINWLTLATVGGILMVGVGVWSGKLSMLAWHDFLDSLDSDGGKIGILLFLMFLGAEFSRLAIPKAEDIIIGAFGALLIALKSSGSNKDRREGPPMPLPTNAGASQSIPVPVPVMPLVDAVDNVAQAITDKDTAQ